MTLRFVVTTVGTGLVVLACSGLAFAGQEANAPSGYGTYVNYCGSCHGPDAKGDGPMRAALLVKPADLTLIAKRNGGKFPTELVFRTIDGRNPVKGHGGQGMPVWGDQFLRVEGGTPETNRARIEALVNYLESIQQKP